MFKNNHKNIQFKLFWIMKKKMLNNNSSGSDSDCIIIATRRYCLKLPIVEKVALRAGSYVICKRRKKEKISSETGRSNKIRR